MGSGMVLYIIVLETSVPITARFHSCSIANILATLVVSLLILIDFCTHGIRTHDILSVSYSVHSPSFLSDGVAYQNEPSARTSKVILIVTTRLSNIFRKVFKTRGNSIWPSFAFCN